MRFTRVFRQSFYDSFEYVGEKPLRGIDLLGKKMNYPALGTRGKSTQKDYKSQKSINEMVVKRLCPIREYFSIIFIAYNL